MAFQTTLNVDQAPGIAGDFCSVNPRHSALSMPGGYVAGPNGVTVGLFVWADTATGKILSNSGTGAPTAFMHRNLQALVTAYPSTFGMTIPAGQGIGEMFKGGDFWMKNAGSGAVAIGMKAFANNTNGTVSYAAAGATVTGSTETKWYAQSIGAAGELIKTTTVPLG
jgi:hypothetical protein